MRRLFRWFPASLLGAGSLVLALAAALPCPAAAEVPASPVAAAAAPRLEIPEAARAAPGFDVEKATEAWMATIPAEKRARSDAYFEGQYGILFLDWAWTVGVAALLLAGGRAKRWRDQVRARIRRRYLADLVLLARILGATLVLSLPLGLWTGWWREHAYGMSNQTLGAFLLDWAKGFGVTLVLAAPMIAALYAVVRRSPRNWWLWGAALMVAFMAFGATIAPVFIDPLFNKYQKLEAGPLRDDILALARAERVPADDVFWFDASRQTKRISANVSGFAGTTRIALNDNLLRRSPRETILAVLGHEMGHYVLHHVTEMLVSFGLVILAGFAFVHFAFGSVLRRWGAGWGVEGIADPAGYPLAVALLWTFLTFTAPVTNSIIRTNEAEADAFGIAVSNEPDGFAFAAVQLSEYRKMRPGPLEEIVFYDHPSGYDRIRRSMEWKALHLDEFIARERAAAPAP